MLQKLQVPSISLCCAPRKKDTEKLVLTSTAFEQSYANQLSNCQRNYPRTAQWMQLIDVEYGH
jgi:hypothetical protein